MGKEYNQFVKFVRNHIKQYGGKLILGRGANVNCNGIMCPGFFDDKSLIIKIGKNDPAFLSTLVHEYCHFLQYLNNIKVYQKSDEASEIVESWLLGKNYDSQILKRAFFLVRAMERDCEKRAVKLIKEYNLPINIKIYAKHANCYIYTHFLMEKTRKYWMYKKSPYKSRIVMKLMPSTMKVRSHVSIPPKIYSTLVSFTI
jgi:hypothetical protein